MRTLAALTCLLAVGGSAAADTGAYHLLGRIPGPDGGWDLSAIDLETRQLLVARSDGVMAIDLDLQSVRPILVAGTEVHGVVPVGDTLLSASTNGASNTLTLFETRTGKIVATIKTGPHPDAVVFEPKSKLLLVMNAKGDNATVVDPAKRSVTASIPLDGSPELAVASGDGLVFDNLEDKNEIAVIDPTEPKVQRWMPLNGCQHPTGLAYDAQSQLLISACANGVAKIVAAEDGKEAATVPIGHSPDGVMVDAMRRLAFVPAGDGTLTVISLNDPAHVKLVSTVKTQPGARTGAIDPVTGRIYLPTATFEPPAKPGARPVAVPGTFRVLVYGP